MLLDELGAGTDPQEGAALAISILEDLRCVKLDKWQHSLSELKAYRVETAYVQNASMEFDTASLRQLIVYAGVPGRKCALKIAKRLGLSDVIVGDASKAD